MCGMCGGKFENTYSRPCQISHCMCSNHHVWVVTFPWQKASCDIEFIAVWVRPICKVWSRVQNWNLQISFECQKFMLTVITATDKFSFSCTHAADTITTSKQVNMPCWWYKDLQHGVFSELSCTVVYLKAWATHSMAVFKPACAVRLVYYWFRSQKYAPCASFPLKQRVAFQTNSFARVIWVYVDSIHAKLWETGIRSCTAKQLWFGSGLK